jgi:hypothetical protein
MTRLILLIATVLVCAGSAAAQTPHPSGHGDEQHQAAVSREPVITEETLPNDVGDWELRWSADYASHEAGSSTLRSPRAQIFFGIVERLGAEIDVPFVLSRQHDMQYGPGDFGATVKWLATESANHTVAMTLGCELAFPTGNVAKRTGEGAAEVHPFVGFRAGNDAAVVQGNVGWARMLRAEDLNARVPYNWAVVVPVGDRPVGLTLELNGGIGLNGAPSEVMAAPGFRAGVWRRASIGVAVPFGLTSTSDRWGLVVQWQMPL